MIWKTSDKSFRMSHYHSPSSEADSCVDTNDLASVVQRLMHYSDFSGVSSSAKAAKPLRQAQGRNNHTPGVSLLLRRLLRLPRRQSHGIVMCLRDEIDAGATGIFTDFPNRLVELLRSC